MHFYLEPGSISSLRWFCVELEELMKPPIRVKTVVRKEDDSSDSYPSYVFHICLEKYVSLACSSSWITSW